MQAIQSLVYQYQNPHVAIAFLEKKSGFTARKIGLSENERKRRIKNKEPIEKTHEKTFTEKHMENLETIKKSIAKGVTYRQTSLNMGRSSDWASNFMSTHRKKVIQGYKAPWE